MFNKRVLFPCISLPLVLLLFFAACEQPTSPGNRTKPTVAVSSSAGTATGVSPIPITVTFSEAMSAFELADLSVGNGTAGSFATTDNKVFTASITPSAEGTVTVDVAADTATSAASGAGNQAAARFSIEYDVTPPGSPKILSPGQGTYTGKNLKPKVTWEAANGFTYDVQIDDTADFSSPEALGNGISGASFAPAADLAVSTVQPVGRRYYLRIRATDAAGNVGAWSGTPKRYVDVGRLGVDMDFNGDGYADIIVGASAADPAGVSNAGCAYIYFGGPSTDTIPDVTIPGTTGDQGMGYGVASAGDVNGDGYADAIVSALNLSASNGTVNIYHGGPSMDAVADLTIQSGSAGWSGSSSSSVSYFGSCVASAGDMNGDGYADVIIGAYETTYYSPYFEKPGLAAVYFGGASMDAAKDFLIKISLKWGRLGYSVASAGDVNGDGYGDVIAGAPGMLTTDSYYINEGHAYLYYGSSSLHGTTDGISADLTFTGAAKNNFFGYSVAGAGDVNADGFADVIIGAYMNSPNGIYLAGSAYLYCGAGGKTMDAVGDATFTGAAANCYFGSSVAGAGDVNGDGYADMIIGEYRNGYGKAHVYHGGASPDTVAELSMSGVGNFDMFGRCVAGAGDVNGDGYADVIAGTEYADSVGTDSGSVNVYHGGVSMDAAVDLTLNGASGDLFGISVASAGDPVSVPRLWCLPFRKREFV